MGLEVFERGRLPRWARVRQSLHTDEVADVRQAVAGAFAVEGTGDRVRPGMRVAVGVGSRGIDRMAEVATAVVAEVCARGGDPFVFPAMGSHGGATADGQRDVLREYGITEATVGAPIRSSMETVEIGVVQGRVPVYFDKLASQADLIVPVNRVKPHTDFHGPIESGLCKMIAIGMGKQKGADTFHTEGFDRFADLIPAVARHSMRTMPIRFGVALVENGLGRLGRIEGIPAEQVEERERSLLDLAREWMARLPGDRIDVLVLDQLGKDVSGIGADSNVINRYYTGALPLAPRIQRIVVRDLTPATEGNSSGLGQADVALRRAVDRMDRATTYMNCITAKTPEGARIPLTVDSDRQALFVAVACCVQVDPERAHIVRAADTKHLGTLWVSEPMLDEVVAGGRAVALEELRPIAFDAEGMLLEE